VICTPFCYECLVKYADDTNLLVPENTDVPLADEYAQIEDWAVKNCVTKELVFQRPHPTKWNLPPIEGTEQLQTAWYYFQCNFNFTSHVDAVLNLCSQRLFLLKQLRDQGMSRGHLHRPTIFQAIVLTR